MAGMELKISIKHSDVIVILLKEKQELDRVGWKDENDMSRKLLAAIDTLVKRNKMVVADLERIEVDSDQQSYTSTRIAKAVAKTVSYCLT